MRAQICILYGNPPTSQRKYAYKYGQVIHGRRYRWLSSYMTPHSDGTPTNIRMYFIFLENRSIGLHFAADNIGLSSLKFFWWAPEFLFISASGAFRPFKVIGGH